MPLGCGAAPDQGNQTIEIAEVRALGAHADAEVYAEVSDLITSLGRNPVAQALLSRDSRFSVWADS